MSPKEYTVYIMASDSGTLYIGITGDLVRRVDEHKSGACEGFSKKHRCNKLVFFETFPDVRDALDREKQLKKWRREKKEALIRSQNPTWTDLTKRW